MLYLIVNPIAGHGRAVQIGIQAEEALRTMAIPYTALHTNAPGHATRLAQDAVRMGANRIISIGGDGTSYEVVNGLIGTQVPLGILPAGTGNDFARAIGLPDKPMDALEMLMTAAPRDINVCRVNDRIFLNICGAGLDVEVLRAAAGMKWLGKGMLPYLYGVLRALLRNQPTRMRITLDGVPLPREEWLIAAVANGQYFGGGMRIAPMAMLDDGLLDVILIRHVPRRTVLRLLPTFISGQHIALTDIVTHVRAAAVRIEGQNLFIQMDGEITQMDEAEFSVLDQGIPLLMPKNPQTGIVRASE